MRKFHAEIAALEMQKCTTCSERFPGLQLRSHSTEALLPEDDDLSGLYSMTVDSPSDDSELSSTQDVDLYDANLSRTFLPLTPSRMTEQEAIRHSVQDDNLTYHRQSHGLQLVKLPSMSSELRAIFPVPSPLCFQQVQPTL